ncbi:MAG: YybH family protein [Opitutaceae bacterium]
MNNVQITEWLCEFARYVREVDYVAGQDLFAADVIAFGSVSRRAETLEDLVENQWKRVWGQTEGFHFDLATARIEVSGSMAWAAVNWESRFIDRSVPTIERSGRATIALRCRAGKWQATHTHFSMSPEG